MIEQPKNFLYINACLTFCNKALTELKIINTTRSGHEYSIVSSHTFSFYRALLQYMFTMEYCKLMEQGVHGNNNIGSLKKLNQKVFNITGDNFRSLFDANQILIEGLYNSEFFKLVKHLRDTQYAHLDSKTTNPLSIKSLTDEQVAIGFAQLKVMYQIRNNCAEFYGKNYDSLVPDRDNRTDNFIAQYGKYKEFYLKINN